MATPIDVNGLAYSGTPLPIPIPPPAHVTYYRPVLSCQTTAEAAGIGQTPLTAPDVAGVRITGTEPGTTGVTIAATSSSSSNEDEDLSIDAFQGGNINFATTSTGNVVVHRPLIVSGGIDASGSTDINLATTTTGNVVVHRPLHANQVVSILPSTTPATAEAGGTPCVMLGNTHVGIYVGQGSPDGVITAAAGSLYLDTSATGYRDGILGLVATSALYVSIGNVDGTAGTVWVKVVVA